MAITSCPKCKGVLNFLINGRTVKLQSDGDVTILMSTQRRTETYDGEFTVEERNPKVTATLVVPLDMEVREIQEYCALPVQIALCDGRVFAGDVASNISDSPYDAKKNLQPIELIFETLIEALPTRQLAPAGIGGGIGVAGAAAGF